MSTFSIGLNSLTSMKNSKSKKFSHKCRICRAPAEHTHFGVISCDSCKMFFRRNGNTEQRKFICYFNGQCKIHINIRPLCTACRLAKCFKCGMSTELFRATRKTKPNRKALVKVQAQYQPKRLPTLNLLQSDKSLLTTNQWTLLTNLYNAYNESQLLSISQRLIDTHDIVQSTNINYQILVNEFLTCTYETAGAYFRSNHDLCKLSFNDRSIILYNAADNVSCMSCGFFMHYCHLIHHDAFLNAMTRMYGKRTVDIHLWTMKFIDPDIVLVKLAFSLFALTEITYSYSSNISNNLTNPINILEIQSKYAEITWKYLLYRYGHYEAVKRFLNLISWFGAITIFMFHAQTLALHVNDVNSLVEQTELSLILDDVDEILETNKTSI